MEQKQNSQSESVQNLLEIKHDYYEYKLKEEDMRFASTKICLFFGANTVSYITLSVFDENYQQNWPTSASIQLRFNNSVKAGSS